MTHAAYIAAGLRGNGCATRNRSVADALESAGIDAYLPSLVSADDPVGILERNRNAIVASDVVVGVLDGAGEGVYYELGFADGLGKGIVLYAETDLTIGKMVRGLWQQLQPEYVAHSIDELVSAVRLAVDRRA